MEILLIFEKSWLSFKMTNQLFPITRSKFWTYFWKHLIHQINIINELSGYTRVFHLHSTFTCFPFFWQCFILILDLEVETKSIFIFLYLYQNIFSQQVLFSIIRCLVTFASVVDTKYVFFKKKEIKWNIITYLFLCSDKFPSTYIYRIKGTFCVFIVSCSTWRKRDC